MTQEQIERLRSGAENHLAMLPSSSLAPDILALLAERDRYEKALRWTDEHLTGEQPFTRAIKDIVQEALRCE